MRNDSDLSGGAYPQQPVPPAARTPSHAAPEPAPSGLFSLEQRARGAESDPSPAAGIGWGDAAAAPTEDLHLEGLQADSGFVRNNPPGQTPRSVPAATRVYEDWQMPAVVEGSAYEGGVFEGPVFEGQVYERSVFEGYVPAQVHLDRLETRRKSVAAKQGWRGLVHSVTGINLAPGKDELYEMALKERIQRMVRRTFPITVMGVKGGVGKTVVTEALGSTFSAVRGDRVIAVDLDPDAGNLLSRHGRESDLTIADLVADPALTRYLDVRAHTSQDKSTRLEVLTGPDFARTPMPLMNTQVEAVMPVLAEHYSLVLMDTGTGLKSNLMSAVLGQTRALVMVSSASIDALEETQVSLEWLRNNGYQHLLDTMVLVINNIQRGKPNIDVERTVKVFSRQIGRERIFVLPFDAHIFEGGQITLELLSATSRRRYLELAAAISELFPRVAAN